MVAEHASVFTCKCQFGASNPILARRFAILLVLGVAGFSQCVWAQSQTAHESGPPNPRQDAPSVIIRSNVRQVLVPVVVRDKKGRYVTGLKADDFDLFEDGTAEKIVAFSAAPNSLILSERASKVMHIGSPANAIFQQPSLNTAPEHTYLICIDALHSSFTNFARVREALQKFFEQESSSSSQYALIVLSRKSTVVQDSTRDPSEILSALQSKRFQSLIGDSDARNVAISMQEFYGVMGRYCGLCGCPVPLQQEKPGCPGARGRVQSFLLSFGQRTLFLNQIFLRNLGQVIAATADMPTTRTILFISDGFNRSPGEELYAIVRGLSPGDKNFEFNPLNTNELMQSVIKLAVQNDVRFYTLDSRGLYTLASIDGSGWDVSTAGAPPEAVDRSQLAVARENTDSLAALANATGGLFFENNNDLLKGIQTAFMDSRQQYVLAYVPSNKNLDGKYRKIHVKVRFRHLRVIAKPGYWATKN